MLRIAQNGHVQQVRAYIQQCTVYILLVYKSQATKQTLLDVCNVIPRTDISIVSSLNLRLNIAEVERCLLIKIAFDTQAVGTPCIAVSLHVPAVYAHFQQGAGFCQYTPNAPQTISGLHTLLYTLFLNKSAHTQQPYNCRMVLVKTCAAVTHVLNGAFSTGEKPCSFGQAVAPLTVSN